MCAGIREGTWHRTANGESAATIKVKVKEDEGEVVKVARPEVMTTINATKSRIRKKSVDRSFDIGSLLR